MTRRIVVPKWYSPRLTFYFFRRMFFRYCIKPWMLSKTLLEKSYSIQLQDSIVLTLSGAPYWITGRVTPEEDRNDFGK